MAGKRWDRGLLAGPLALVLAALALLILAASCSSSNTGAAAPPGEEATTPPASSPTPNPSQTTSPPPAAPSATPTQPKASGRAATPTAQATPVFVDEPCDPGADPGPQVAINGLTLYCVGNEAGVPVWATAPPPSPSPAPQTKGSICDSRDRGKVVQGGDGRPLECLRDPDGRYRWVDVS